MKWKGRRGSANVEDRRGGRSGGGRTARKVGAPLGCGGLIIIIIIALMGGDVTQLLSDAGSAQMQQREAPAQGQARPDDELKEFVSVVLAETENVWNPIFRKQLGREYQEPVLVLFDGQVSSACGNASAATGPFYCPGDQKLYIDLSFYRDLSKRFGAPGDFAMAYVVAHEVAHHVQQQLGYTRKVHSQKGRIPEREYNDLSVRLELQADFLSGLWAHHMRNQGLLDEGDVEEALRCANAIGDDRLQKQARGYVVPDSFTHGTSAQRVKWFRLGLETGDLRQGDTFSARNL